MIVEFTEDKLTDIVDFIHKNNNIDEYRIGYVGDTKEDIIESLENDFSDYPLKQSIYLDYINNDLNALFALDIDTVSNTIEVWGPFYGEKTTIDDLYLLWIALYTKYKDYNFNFFISESNKFANEFLTEKLKLKLDSKHIDVLKNIIKSELRDDKLPTNLSIKSNIYSHSIVKLHDELFKDSYLSGENLFRQIGKNDCGINILSLNNKKDIGYLYYSLSYEDNDIYIDYIGLADPYHGNGYSVFLMNSLFNSCNFNQFKSIRATVLSENYRALNFFKNYGFIEDKINILYKLKSNY